MNFTVQELKDFQVCELYYKFRYLDQLRIPSLERALMFERFENTLKRVVSFFFYKKQGGSAPSYNSLMNRWEKLWFPKDMTAYDLAVERHDHGTWGNIANYSNIATASLLKFHEDFVDDDRQPLLIDESFLVPITQKTRLQGSYDLVLRDGNDHTVIKWFAKQKRHHKDSYMFDFAALRLAYEYRTMKRPVTSRYGFYDLTSTQPGFSTYDVNAEEIASFIFWARKMQDTEEYIPRRGFTTYCKGCPFDAECKKWKPTLIQVS